MTKLKSKSTYKWCKADPKRFEKLRVYCLETKALDDDGRRDDWPFPQYVFREMMYMDNCEGHILDNQAIFDAALFYREFVNSRKNFWMVWRYDWARETFNKLRPYILKSDAVAEWYNYYGPIVDLSDPCLTPQMFKDEFVESGLDKDSEGDVVRLMYKHYAGWDEPDMTLHNRSVIMYYPPYALRRMKDSETAADAVRGMSRPNERYKSLNDAEAAHAQWVIEDQANYLREHPLKHFVYKPEFLTLLKDHGWYAPDTNHAMYLRGRIHNNCVGSYHKNQGVGSASVSVVIFTETSEAELSLRADKGVIKEGSIVQCKTKYNCEAPRDGLKDILAALKGKSVKTVQVDHKGD
jgi:hypothetical protein